MIPNFVRNSKYVYFLILLIKSKINTSNKFSFTEIKTDDVNKEMKYIP